METLQETWKDAESVPWGSLGVVWKKKEKKKKHQKKPTKMKLCGMV